MTKPPQSVHSIIFFEIFSTPRTCHILSFLILSFLVHPRKHDLSILISATSRSFSCFLVNGTISSSYVRAGLTTVLYSFPFTCTGAFLSHISHFIFTVSILPNCGSQHLNSFIPGTVIPFIIIAGFSICLPTHSDHRCMVKCYYSFLSPCLLQ